MNQADFVDFFLQMQADFDLPDEKICNTYFQTGWQNALLPYEKMDCMRALQEYAESPFGLNPPRIAKILEIIRRNTGGDDAGKVSAGGAWQKIIDTCQKGVLWAGDEKKKQILSSIDEKSLQALETMSGLSGKSSEEEKARGAFSSLVRIASTDLSSIGQIREEFTNTFNRIEDISRSRYAKRLEGQKKQPLPLPGKTPEAEKETKQAQPPRPNAQVPKYIIDIIASRKKQYRSENREP